MSGVARQPKQDRSPHEQPLRDSVRVAIGGLLGAVGRFGSTQDLLLLPLTNTAAMVDVAFHVGSVDQPDIALAVGRVGRRAQAPERPSRTRLGQPLPSTIGALLPPCYGCNNKAKGRAKAREICG